MDDSCAVCADALEWVAYGACGHREVCSTCVARLRFICDDHRCCICKTLCPVVFVTKAMGDYTRTVNDFPATFPGEPKEGRCGSYWFHEDTQAFFDDADHYRMVKAMCKLSCTICDDQQQQQQQQQQDSQGGPPGFKKRAQRFRNVGHLKSHLIHNHRLFMCDLCLEGRKVFICEQKLYNRAQLNQHKRTGDSIVDGTESERGGFTGHPMCEFCLSHFYGENELYTHMTTEHYTCHMCQRQHPGQYDYFRDYDDLEAHFRHDHHLCEDEACLAKKFIVFQTESELKRHNALEHGGRMSRSKRNAVLQIPTSFRYRSSAETGHHRGRRRSFRRESSPDNDLNRAIQASLEGVSAGGALPDALSSSAAATSVHEYDNLDASDIDPLVQPFESLSATESEPSSRYRQAVSQSSAAAPLAESSFPPLAAAPSSQQRSQQESDGSNQNTMAARLRRQNHASVLNVARPTPAKNRAPPPAISNLRPAIAPASSNPRPGPSPASSSSSKWPAPASSSSSHWPAASSNSSLWPAPAASPAPGQVKPATTTGFPALAPGQVKQVLTTTSGSSNYATSLQARPEPGLALGGSWASRNAGSGSRLNHSSSAPNLMESRSFDPVSDFPPVSAVQSNRLPSSGQAVVSQAVTTEDVQTANKSLVERIRAALDFDENKYSAFKEISQEYRQGLVGTLEYLEYVKQFDLTHLVLDLARLCPDAHRQRELIGAYNASQKCEPQETFWGNGTVRVRASSASKKDKGKKIGDIPNSSSKETLADSVINTVRGLQSQVRPLDGEVEVLEKDGYRATKGKAAITAGEDPSELCESNQYVPKQAASEAAGQTSGDGGGKSKQKKKTSKFHRVRLGDASPAAVLDVSNSTTDANSSEEGGSSSRPEPSEGLPAGGVWRGGVAQRLFAK